MKLIATLALFGSISSVKVVRRPIEHEYIGVKMIPRERTYIGVRMLDNFDPLNQPAGVDPVAAITDLDPLEQADCDQIPDPRELPPLAPLHAKDTSAYVYRRNSDVSTLVRDTIEKNHKAYAKVDLATKIDEAE